MFAPSRSYRVAAYIRAAEKLGYRLWIVSDSRHSLIPDIASGITVDFSRTDQARNTILDTIRNQNIVAVIATDDLVVTLASSIAAFLDLPHNDPESSQLTRRKDLARIRLRERGCNTPHFQIMSLDDAAILPEPSDFPVVLKPLMLSGSRGVIRADNSEQFRQAADVIGDILSDEPGTDYERSHLLVEEFLNGPEIAFDGFVSNGHLLPLALFDKPIPMNGPCFEESYYITPSRLDISIQQEVINEIERCCNAYGLRHGPVHAEARITDQGVVLLEMASRTIGGQCAQLIEYALGAPLEQIIIALMCGDSPAIERSEDHAGVLMIPIPRGGVLKRVEGMLQAQAVPEITNLEIHIQPGYELVPLPRGSSYLGFIFARADSFDGVLHALADAHSKLRFVTSPKWTIEPG